jgi:hypothetical protein
MLKGEKGDTGYGISNIQMNDDYTLTITLENGMHFNTSSIRGEKGERGACIRSVELRDDYSLLFTLDNGETLETTAILGKEFENIRTLEASATSASKTATSASTSASASAQSATNASESASASAQSATNASQSATSAQESASSASTSADTATSKATEASASATKAKESETNAKQSETNASNSAKEAKASADSVANVVTDVSKLKEDIGNKAPAIIKKALGKTIIINDSSNLPIKTLSGTGKIIITGKNILKEKIDYQFVPFEAKAGTLFTLITNGELSEGGNIKFTDENDEDVWFAIDKGKTKVSAKILSNVKGFKNMLTWKSGLKYCLSVGENNEYEEYVEQVITAPVDSEQLKAIHTNYPTTVLTSENEISVEYVADTEAYIENRINEELNRLIKDGALKIESDVIR